MEGDECYNCDEREAMDGGTLCEQCREEMWEGERTHHGRLDERTVEELERANGKRESRGQHSGTDSNHPPTGSPCLSHSLYNYTGYRHLNLSVPRLSK